LNGHPILLFCGKPFKTCGKLARDCGKPWENLGKTPSPLI
jgi:hypothetical protein